MYFDTQSAILFLKQINSQPHDTASWERIPNPLSTVSLKRKKQRTVSDLKCLAWVHRCGCRWLVHLCSCRMRSSTRSPRMVQSNWITARQQLAATTKMAIHSSSIHGRYAKLAFLGSWACGCRAFAQKWLHYCLLDHKLFIRHYVRSSTQMLLLATGNAQKSLTGRYLGKQLSPKTFFLAVQHHFSDFSPNHLESRDFAQNSQKADLLGDNIQKITWKSKSIQIDECNNFQQPHRVGVKLQAPRLHCCAIRLFTVRVSPYL